MLLYVMRHGPAEDRAPSGRDADRKLTQEGQELVVVAARELARKVGPSAGFRIAASPYARSRQTAEIIRSTCPGAAVELRPDLEPDEAPPLAVVRDLVGLGGDWMIVGHQPSLEQLVRALVDGEGQAALPFGVRTAVIVCLAGSSQPPVSGADAASPGRWQLRAVLDPRKMSQPMS